MTDEPRDKIYGTPMSEVIARIPNELPIDAVGLWQIIPEGIEGFGLNAAALDDFVARAIGALLDAGAVPVKHEPGSHYDWTWQKQYGTTHAEIIASIIAEWHQVGNDHFEIVGKCPWFATPSDNPDRKYLRMD